MNNTTTKAINYLSLIKIKTIFMIIENIEDRFITNKKIVNIL